jgi:hypothetical protein
MKYSMPADYYLAATDTLVLLAPKKKRVKSNLHASYYRLIQTEQGDNIYDKSGNLSAIMLFHPETFAS